MELFKFPLSTMNESHHYCRRSTVFYPRSAMLLFGVKVDSSRFGPEVSLLSSSFDMSGSYLRYNWASAARQTDLHILDISHVFPPTKT
jgi:hypothetical protein